MSKSKAISPQVLLGLFETMRRIWRFEETASRSTVKMLRRCTRLWNKTSNFFATRPNCLPNLRGESKTR